MKLSDMPVVYILRKRDSKPSNEMGSGQANSVVHKSASFPHERERGICEILTLPLKTKEVTTARMKTNMIVPTFIVKGSLIMARVDIAAKVCQIIKLKRTIFDPTINKAFMAHTRLTRLHCDRHNQMRWINFANTANDIDQPLRILSLMVVVITFLKCL